MKKIGASRPAIILRDRDCPELAGKDGSRKEETVLNIAEFNRFRQQGAALAGFARSQFARCFFYMIFLMVNALARFAEGRWFRGREGSAGMGKAQAERQNYHQGNPHHIPPGFYVIPATCRHRLSTWCCIGSAELSEPKKKQFAIFLVFIQSLIRKFPP